MLFKKFKIFFSSINENLYKSLSKNNKKDIVAEAIIDVNVENIEENINIPKIKQLKK